MHKFFDRIVEKFRESKKLRIAAVAALLALILILYFVTLGDESKQKSEETAETQADYTESVRTRLQTTISKIKGVGKTQIMINFESTPELIIAYIESISGSGSTQKSPQILTQQGNQLPLVLKTVYPKALGAIVVAEGAANVKVKLSIVEAVATVLDLAASKINVYPM